MSANNDPNPPDSGPAASRPASNNVSSPAAATDGRATLTPPRDAGDAAMCAVLAENWWAVALRGVFGILFGLIALVWPVATMLSLALLFAAYLLADGVFGIVAAVRAAQANERWGLLLAEGVLNIVMGVIAALFPGAALFAFVIITAAWALVSGGLMLAAAFKLTREHGRWLLALGGVVSIIYGLLLISAPLLGLVVLTWWLGAYALAFGVILLVLAFRLRGQKNQRTGAGPALPRNA
jgi:uncharacterized membrane protein HdeD (DUF308 family)